MSDDELIPGPECIDQLRTPNDGICWWCRRAPASTAEHKYKRSELDHLMGNDALYWGDHNNLLTIRGRSGLKRDRYKVLKWPKSLCEACNTKRSRSMDQAYDQYFQSIRRTPLAHRRAGVDLASIYGEDWRTGTLDLARYYGKHFGCRLSKEGLPIPQSLRAFLDGAEGMDDVRMSLITTQDVRRAAPQGLTLSPGFALMTGNRDAIEQIVLAAYIGALGVRYDWRAHPTFGDEFTQFFDYPTPIINRFQTEVDVFLQNVKYPSQPERFLQWPITMIERSFRRARP